MSSLDIEEGGWNVGQQGAQFDSSKNYNNQIEFKNLLEKVLRKNVKTHRVSLLITSAFSLAAALIVITTILHDARALQRRSVSLKKKNRPSLWACIHTAEVMPLAIAIACAIQSCIFLAIQSQSLGTTWISGCTLTAQLIWPAIWIVAFTVSAFALEATFRSLHTPRFEPRGKLHLLTSVILIILFLLATFITARVVPSENVCWGSLVWWAIHFVQPSIAVAAGIILLNLVIGVILIVQLVRTVEMSRDERIAASRVIYSLSINMLVTGLALPFFVSFAFRDVNNEAASMADSVFTLNGLVHGVVHLFLRANSESMAIRFRDTAWTKDKPIRLFGPNDLNIHDYISTPIVRDRDIERSIPYTSTEKKSAFSDTDGAFPRQQFISIHPDVPPPPFSQSTAPPKISRASASNYSIFPPEKPSVPKPSQSPIPEFPSRSTSLVVFNVKSKSRMPVDSTLTVYSADSNSLHDELMAPRPLFSGHKRSESETTSAIVEIALRLSSAPSDADSVYIREPITRPPPAKLGRSPSLLTPDKYVAAARLAEAAKSSRPVTPGESNQTADLVKVQKPVLAPKLVGLPKNPGYNKRRLQANIRDSIAAKITCQRSNVDRPTNKQLPPVPDREKPQEIAALEALIKSSHPLALAPVKQSKLPVPDWRKAPSQNTATKKTSPSATPQTQDENPERSPPDGWL